MYSILDFIQTYLLKTWNIFIFATIIDILCAALIIYAIYHLLLVLKDCFALPENDNYVHGEGNYAIDTDTSTSTESDLEDTFQHDPIFKSIKAKHQADANELLMGEITDDDEFTDNFTERTLGKPDVILGKFRPSSHSSDQNLKNNVPCACPLDQHLDNTDLYLAGSGDESEHGIFPLEFLSTAQPIAHSSPLRKNYQN